MPYFLPKEIFMAVKIAITGFGRIGRLILRAIYELNHQDIKVVAINSSRGDTASNAHLASLLITYQ